jgi:HK97 gp10 family phage protein
MAGGVSVRIAGLDQLTAALHALGTDLPPTLAAAGEKGMLVLEAAIKERAPVKTGNLRDSYTTESKTGGSSVTVSTGTNVEYGPAMEYGPRPHVRPALDATRGDIIAVVEAELRRAIAR